MRRLVWLALLVAAPAWAAPDRCPAGEKPFHCHALALRYHLGLDIAVDVTVATKLYGDACDKGEAASCNNLAVLANTHPELADHADPHALLKKACDRFEPAACDNARRLAHHPELVVQVALGTSALAEGEGRWHQLEDAACRAGDLFRCRDAASQGRIAAVLAEECRTGTKTECFEAAQLSGNAAFDELMAAGCADHQGKACHALATRKLAAGAKEDALLALWVGACADKDFEVSADDVAARAEACARWGKVIKKPTEVLRAATITAGYCAGERTETCALAVELFDRAGAPARAFAIAKQQCDARASSPACTELARRYVLGLGTPVDIPKALQLLGDTCAPATEGGAVVGASRDSRPASSIAEGGAVVGASRDSRPASSIAEGGAVMIDWSVCKRVARYLDDHREHLQAARMYSGFCNTTNLDACYRQARAAEAIEGDVECGDTPTLPELKRRYDSLCASGYKDACRRAPTMCARAMTDFLKPAKCGYGIGDGTEVLGLRYHAVVELCTQASWTPKVRAEMKKIDEGCRELERSGGHCQR
jgi:TPR repeat protein